MFLQTLLLPSYDVTLNSFISFNLTLWHWHHHHHHDNHSDLTNHLHHQQITRIKPFIPSFAKKLISWWNHSCYKFIKDRCTSNCFLWFLPWKKIILTQTTNCSSSVLNWWLEPGTNKPGAVLSFNVSFFKSLNISETSARFFQIVVTFVRSNR